jgi:1-acyl-sn-glycerol-3-phosphate acyltransferase
MNTSELVVRGVLSVCRRLKAYHDYEARGLEHLPRIGPALLVCNHSLATYDAFLLGAEILEKTGRQTKGLGDRALFRTPLLGRLSTHIGIVNGTRKNALELLRDGELVGIAPGGMREALRTADAKYRIDWRGRLGFIWMSMLSGAPIVLAACPAADDIFDVVDNRVTDFVYSRFRLPLPFVIGRKGLPVPHPVKLVHTLSAPIFPPENSGSPTKEAVERHHQFVVARMEELMQAGRKKGKSGLVNGLLDRAGVDTGHSKLFNGDHRRSGSGSGNFFK